MKMKRQTKVKGIKDIIESANPVTSDLSDFETEEKGKFSLINILLCRCKKSENNLPSLRTRLALQRTLRWVEFACIGVPSIQ